MAGSDGLPIGTGDVITTRKNNSALGVTNRQTWTVQGIGSDGTVWAVDNSSPLKHRRSVPLPSSYVSEHVHLGYAATAYGVQGVTTTTAHTLLSEALDASGVYVGMTRARDSNVLHIVAEDLDNAREQFVDALQLDRADRGLQVATADARASVAGLAAVGPVKLVNDERDRLTELIANAEREAARWEHAAGLLAAQAETHAREEASARDALTRAESHLAAVRSDIVLSLFAQATADGQAYLDAHAQQDAALDADRSTGRLGRRAAQRRLDAARAEARDARVAALGRWGSVPATGRRAATRDGLATWAFGVAHQGADAERLVAHGHQQVAQARGALKQIRWRHRAETEELAIRIYGRRDAASLRAVSGAHRARGRAQRWQQYAHAARADLTRIESLPLGRAVQLIETRRTHAAEVEIRQTAASGRTSVGVSTDRRTEPTDPWLGHGL